MTNEAIRLAGKPVKHWFYNQGFNPFVEWEHRFLGNLVVCGWAGEGTRELRVNLWGRTDLLVRWTYMDMINLKAGHMPWHGYAGVLVQARRACVVCGSNRAWNTYNGHNLCHDCFGTTRCGVREHQVSMNDAGGSGDDCDLTDVINDEADERREKDPEYDGDVGFYFDDGGLAQAALDDDLTDAVADAVAKNGGTAAEWRSYYEALGELFGDKKSMTKKKRNKRKS